MGVGEVGPGDDLAALLVAAVAGAGGSLQAGDCLVVSSKVVSKALGLTWEGTRESAVDSATVRVVAERVGEGGAVTRVVEDLKTKKTWFEANQARVTGENKAKAEKEIEKLAGRIEKLEAHAHNDATPPNGDGEKPAEPAPTPAAEEAEKSTPVPDEAVEEKLEVVAESEAVAAEEQS